MEQTGERSDVKEGEDEIRTKRKTIMGLIELS
jgi:hypothetical protein